MVPFTIAVMVKDALAVVGPAVSRSPVGIVRKVRSPSWAGG
jgi:hypothetical protein